jgi:hypothetical protein
MEVNMEMCRIDKNDSLEKWAEIFFCAFSVLKPIYLFPSGSIGIADILLMISWCMMFGRCCVIKRDQVLFKEDTFWYLFIAGVVLVNGIYFVKLKRFDFIKYIVYWLYCTCAIWLFRYLMSDCFLNKICWMCRINLAIQLAVFVMGYGRYWHEGWGGSRFMGTFNDPNQFAFFMFTMMLLLYLEYTLHPVHKKFWPCFLIYLYLLTKAKSTGMFLGTAIFIACLLMVVSWKWCKSMKKTWLWFAVLAICGGAVLAVLFVIWPSADFDIMQSDYSILARVQYKIWQFSKGNFADLLYDRKCERIVQYPRYLLYGAGEGVFERFPMGDFINKITPGVFDREYAIEIHSSFFSVWFCYGIIPLTFLILWLRKNFSCMNLWQMPAVIALAAESFTLMNCRQPFFWLVFVLVSAWDNRREEQ